VSNILSVIKIWVSLFSENDHEKIKNDSKKLDLFGKKAPYLQPIVDFSWKGKIENGIAYLKQFIKLTVPSSVECKIEGEKLSDILKNAQSACYQDNFTSPFDDALQNHPFYIIDLRLENGEFLEELNNSNKEVLNLLLNAKISEYDFEVYEKIGIMKNGLLLNLSSLKKCFLTISPKSVLLIRNNIPDIIILPSMLEAATMVAIAFVGYSELLDKLDKWDKTILITLESFEKKNSQNMSKPLQNITKSIKDLIEYNLLSSSLLEFHMSYVTSSIVAQHFYSTFSEISGLDNIHHSLLTKLQNCERILNHFIDYHQLTNIQKLRGRGSD